MQSNIKLYFRGTSRPEILPFRTINAEVNGQDKGTRQIIQVDDVARENKNKLGDRLKMDGTSFTLNSIEQRGIIENPKMIWYGRDIKTGDNKTNPLQEAHRVYDTSGVIQTLKPIPIKIVDGGQGGKIGLYAIQSPRRIRDTQKSESFITSWDCEAFGDVNEEELKILECWRSNHRSTKYGDLSVGNGMTIKDLQEFWNWDISPVIKSLINKGYLVLKEDNRLYSNSCRKVAGKVGFAYLTTNNSWSPTITANTLSEQAHFDGIKIRRLTPIECERLQGFPDNWTEGFSDTQRYKMMGNAVTTKVISAIAERLLR